MLARAKLPQYFFAKEPNFLRGAYIDKHFWIARVHPDDRGQVLQPLLDIFLATGDAQVEYRFHRQDGALRWFSSAYSSSKIDDGGWLVTTVSHDISDRKQSAAALRASEEKYRLLLESMDEGFCLIEMIFDGHGKPIDLGPSVGAPAATAVLNAIARRQHQALPFQSLNLGKMGHQGKKPCTMLAMVAVLGTLNVRWQSHPTADHLT